MAVELALTDPNNGQLAGAKATLYTCPTGRTANISQVTYVNTDAGTVSVNLYFKRSGGTSRRKIPMNMTFASGSSMHYGDGHNPVTLKAGDEIEGDASVANVVDWSVDGFERPA